MQAPDTAQGTPTAAGLTTRPGWQTAAMAVTALGALCEFTGEAPQEGGRTGLSFSVSEWVDVDGRRVTLHEDFGFTSVLTTDDDPWEHYDADLVRSGVLSTVLPEDDDPDDADEEHPWTWLAELCAEQGVTTSPEELKAVGYVVELGPELTRRFASGPAGTP